MRRRKAPNPEDDPIFEIEDDSFRREVLGVWNVWKIEEELRDRERGGPETGAGQDIRGAKENRWKA